jgi:hypothetical protein
MKQRDWWTYGDNIIITEALPGHPCQPSLATSKVAEDNCILSATQQQVIAYTSLPHLTKQPLCTQGNIFGGINTSLGIKAAAGPESQPHLWLIQHQQQATLPHPHHHQNRNYAGISSLHVSAISKV